MVKALQSFEVLGITNTSTKSHIPEDRNSQDSICYTLSHACVVSGVLVNGLSW